MNGQTLSTTGRLLDQLRGIRAAVRRRLVGYGVLAVGGGGMIAFLAVVGLDWLLRFPPLLRIVVTVFFVFGFFAATYHWIIRPLRAGVGLAELSSRLEKYFPQLTDRLSTTVNYLQRDDVDSPAMVAEVVRSTEELLGTVRLDKALSQRRIAWLAAAVVAGGATLGTLAGVQPGWIRTGLVRYANPFGETEWPRRTHIVPLSDQVAVAMGESAAVAMRVERGRSDELRVLLHLRQADGTETTLTMQREPEGLYTATIDTVTADTVFWFEADDDTTRNRPGSIRVVRRPEIVDARVTISSPPHATVISRREERLSEGPVRAAVGSMADIHIRVSKPVSRDAEARDVALILEHGERLALQPEEDDPLTLSTTIELREHLTFRVELQDEDGFRNFGSPTYTLLADPDRPPVVAFVLPRSDADVTARGSVDLVVRVEDDFGIRSLSLQVEQQSTDIVHRTDLLPALVRADDDIRIRGEARSVFEPGSLNAKAGDVFVVTALATDNAPAEPEGLTARSAPVRIRIISETEFEGRLRDELAAVEERIRQAALEQTGLADRTEALVRPSGEVESLSDRELEAVAALASQQSRLGRRMVELARRLTELAESQRRNRPDDADGQARLSALAQRLDEIAGASMAPAAKELTQAAQEQKAEPQQLALREAMIRELEAAERLRGLMKDLSRWGTLQNVATRTRDLLDRQNSVMQQTARVGQSTLGKSADALSADEAAALRQVQRQQEQLSRDAEQLLARMEQLVQSPTSRDAAAAETMETALRAAAAQDLMRRLEAAAGAIGENRTAAATADQKAAAAALQAMLNAMKERDQRELEDLQKRLREAEQQVAELLQEQELVRNRTDALAESENRGSGIDRQEPTKANPAELAGDQGRLKRNARSLGEEFTESERLAAAGRLLREAVSPMSQAEERLSLSRWSSAVPAQNEALDLLAAALARLEQLAAEAEEEALIRSLAEVRERLEELVAGQTEVTEAATRLHHSLQSTGKLSRVEIREAARLAGREAELRGAVDELLPDLTRVPVYEWILNRVAGWMSRVQEGLENRRIEEDLVRTSERIVREIQKLITAIAETQRLPRKTEFVERESGQGGEGAPMKSKPVPPIAELLVLKTMQEDLNDRTRRHHETVDPQHPSERDLREIQLLGEDQSEVRRLAELLTGRARATEGRP
jgi:hypothetical protein